MVKVQLHKEQRKFLEWIYTNNNILISPETVERIAMVLNTDIYLNSQMERDVFNSLRDMYLDGYNTYNQFQKDNL